MNRQPTFRQPPPDFGQPPFDVRGSVGAASEAFSTAAKARTIDGLILWTLWTATIVRSFATYPAGLPRFHADAIARQAREFQRAWPWYRRFWFVELRTPGALQRAIYAGLVQSQPAASGLDWFSVHPRHGGKWFDRVARERALFDRTPGPIIEVPDVDGKGGCS